VDEHEARARLENLHPEAYRWALSCCRDRPDEAEDVLHTSYLAILQGRARFDGHSEFRTWLFGVIRLTAVGQRRRRRLRELILLRDPDRLAPSEGASTDMSAVQQSEHALIGRAVRALSPRQREVVELVFYHDLSVEAAAAVMKVGLGSARTHYARAKAKLSTILNTGEEVKA
jgi:RNA polymerase sigma factor (sigma-70 family)